MGYNLAHFYPAGNTVAWMRYTGVNGARLFLSPSAVGELYGSDDIPASWGDGVSDQTSFLTRKSGLRAWQATNGSLSNPFTGGDKTPSSNPSSSHYVDPATVYINWAYWTNNYAQNLGSGDSTANQIVLTYAAPQLRALGASMIVNITCSPSSFPGTGASSFIQAGDWNTKWEIWQHYYAQAYFLAKN
jgi:hypothetical protein